MAEKIGENSVPPVVGPRTLSAGLFREVALDSAGDLLDAIASHRSELWANTKPPHDDRWIFRGQRDAEWDLVPNSQRDGFLKFVRDMSDENPMSEYERGEKPSTDLQLKLEKGLVNRFVIGVDRQGLAVPGDRPELRDYYAEVNLAFEGFPAVEHRPMFALAQHYGIPTRLLDWSHSPKVAAYFACVATAKNQAKGKPSAERFAVWALSQDFIQRFAREWEPKISIVTAPTADNPNLHAQQGLFTLVEYRKRPEGLRDDVDTPDIPTVDQLFKDPKNAPKEEPREVPPLWKFSVPAREAGVVLKFLARESVTGGQVYHGHKAVLEAIHEQFWYR